MKQKPIYVEIYIASDIETLWEYTQTRIFIRNGICVFLTLHIFIGCQMNRRDFYMKHESVLG